MTSMQILFMLVATVVLASAVLVVTARRVIHAAFWLVLTLLGVAVLFVMLESGFFAIVQALVYVGAIAILIIFGVMLTHQMMDTGKEHLNSAWWLVAAFCIVLFIGLAYSLSIWKGFYTVTTSVPPGGEDIAGLGMALTGFDGFMVPFEIASVMLVAAMIGSIFIARERKGGQD